MVQLRTMADHSTPSTDRQFNPSHHQRVLSKGCRELGIELTDHQLYQFELYSRTLVEWNQKFNLTAITDYEEIQVKHFLDSLAGLPIIREEVGEASMSLRPLHLADIGTGAGFPGIPLKIAAPHLNVVLIDGTGKKISFLRNIITTLGLTGIETVQGRAEELGRQSAFRGHFDLVTARAVAPLNTLVEYILPLVRNYGLAVIYKGAGATEEFGDARRAIELLGGETVRLAPVDVPLLDGIRYVVLIKKIKETPPQFPRGQGLPRKKPLA